MAIPVAIWIFLTTHFPGQSIPSPDGKYVFVVKATPLSAIDSDYIFDIHDASGRSLPGEPFHLKGPGIGEIGWSGNAIVVRGVSSSGWIGRVENGRQIWEDRLCTSDSDLAHAEEMYGTTSVILYGDVTDRGLSNLSKCSTLTRVQFTGAQITAEGLRRFKEAAPRCLVWDMSGPPPVGWYPATEPTTFPAQ